MEIKDIILKSIYGRLTDEEQQLLADWSSQRDHARLYERIRATIDEKQAVEYLASIDVERALAKVKGAQYAGSSVGAEDSAETDGRQQTAAFVTLRSPLFRIAAALVLLIVGGTFWYREHTRVTPPVVSEAVELAMQQSAEKGLQGAVVVSGNGQKKVVTTQELTRYHVDDDFAEQLAEARRITTYQDKEYWVTLDDGTLVHLNYDSRLIYPEKFGDRRDVILEGEAYFMVAKDKSRQFVVHTPQGDVKVYGTEFNVNTRSKGGDGNDNGGLSVVLVKGSVSFTPARGKEQMLTPGQELSIVNAQLSINEVDTAPYVAWNEGKFFFEEWPLERIMEVMARWYGREVEFKSDDIKQLKYSGNFDRYEDIHPTMEAIETITGLKITLTPDKIIIEP
jgi:ferric-dicitrate binding protein FerR (iron transport regulator)